MRRHVTFCVIAAVLVALGGFALTLPAQPASAAGGRPSDNDAASGRDAGDAPADALPIGGQRRWNANLTPPGTDSDWYRLPATEAFCAVADATVNSPGQLTLTGAASRASQVSVSADPHDPTRLAFAAPGGALPYFGIEPPLLQAFTASGSTKAGNPPSPGRYTFSVAASSYADLDPQGDGEGIDAGPVPATAAPLAPECSAGRLAGGADVADAYAFDVGPDGRALTISFAIASGGAAQLTIRTPTGAPYATLASGDAVEVHAFEPGRWSATVESGAPAALGLAGLALPPLALSGGAGAAVDYILGVTEGPGDPAPCRPSCME